MNDKDSSINKKLYKRNKEENIIISFNQIYEYNSIKKWKIIQMQMK